MNQIKIGDLVRQKKHVGLRRPVYRVEDSDGAIVWLEHHAIPQYVGLFEKLVAEVRNDDGTVYRSNTTGDIRSFDHLKEEYAGV